MSALERRIQAAMRAGACAARDVERVGPFTATFARGSAHPAFNYAIPEEGAEPSAADVAALVEAYRSRDRVPRLEYIPVLAPAAEAALREAGFAVEARTPLMVLERSSSVPSPEGVELVDARSEEDVRAAVTAQHEAYGEPEPPSEGWIEGVRRSLDAGGLLVLARDAASGEAAGAGQCTSPLAGATELTSVGVRPAFRRRGIAAAMTAWLAERMASRGAELVYLTAAGDAEAQIYARAGFARIGEALYVSLRR